MHSGSRLSPPSSHHPNRLTPMRRRPGRSCPSLSGPEEGLQQKRLQTQQPCGVIAPSLSLSCQHDSSVLCMERGSTSMWGPVGAALRCPSVHLYGSIFVAQATASCPRDYGRTTSLASFSRHAPDHSNCSAATQRESALSSTSHQYLAADTVLNLGTLSLFI